MSILRRVHEEKRRRLEYPDDCGHVLSAVVDELSPDERREWRRQYLEFEAMVPEYGSYEAALDAFERLHPDAA